MVVDERDRVVGGTDPLAGAQVVGRVAVQAWNEQSGEPMTASLTIKAGANENNLDLKAGGQAISPDKFGGARQ